MPRHRKSNPVIETPNDQIWAGSIVGGIGAILLYDAATRKDSAVAETLVAGFLALSGVTSVVMGARADDRHKRLAR